jgi:hypothetical protein
MRTAAQRIAAYNARMVSSQTDPVRAAVAENQKTNFAGYENEFYPKQQSLRAILNAAGIPVIQYVVYEAYNGELYHAWKVAAGDSLALLAHTLLVKYSSPNRLGASASGTLALIAATVWGIDYTPSSV